MCSCSGSCNCNSTTIPRGPQGVPGPKGDKGDPGTNGATPTITVGTVDTVPFGDPATVTNTGVAPNAIFNFEIPQGEQGLQGIPGPVSVERIKADVQDYGTGPGDNANISVNFNELNADGKIITFTIVSGTEDGTGVFLSTGFSISDGLTTTSLFNISIGEPYFGISPAKIKYDRDPNLTPSGYQSFELINFITADIKITRITSTGARIEGTIYGYNSETQTNFGLSKFPQKIWHLRTGIIYPTNFTITSSVGDDGSGTYTGMSNILRYNTTL
jgi:hypothetical protein